MPRDRVITFIAEDDPDLLEFLVMELEAVGAEVMPVPNGEKLTDLLEANPGPAVVFLDIHMPERDGIEVLMWLAAHPRPLVVYFVTGSAGASLSSARMIAKAHGLTVGGVLLKPFSVSELHAAQEDGLALLRDRF